MRGSARFLAADHSRALSDIDEAIARGADDVEILITRATALFNLGRYEAAFDQIRACVSERPQYHRAICTYAWFLATCPVDRLRDGELAMRLAREAHAHGGDRYWLCEASLAAACAELGRFDEAMEHAEKSHRSAPPVFSRDAARPLAAYRHSEPYRSRG
jgi:tetratricopeptide (TPR) repeat protein